MQVFLPYADFKESARVLDYRRLGKQRVECKQILAALLGESKGWVNHPATKMWRCHERALCDYAITICENWRERGYKDSLLPWFQERRGCLPETGAPFWLGNASFHRAHRSNLTRKDKEHYSKYWDERPDLEYI